MVKLAPYADGTVVEKLSEAQMMGLIRKTGAVVDPRLVEEGWVEAGELEALGWIEYTHPTPALGEEVFVPRRVVWARVRVWGEA